MKKLLASAALVAALAFSSVAAIAQTSPGLTYGQVPTAAQWNSYFAAKQDVLGFVPLNVAGGVMTGRLVTAAAPLSGGVTTAGLNLPHGSAPGSPANGDLWTTSGGLFVRVNGTTIGPLAGASAGAFAATSPITVSFPASVVTYAIDLTALTASTITSSSATALAVGRQGSTDPALLIDASTASSATGIKITAAAAAGGVSLAAISSGSNEALAIDAKGSGTITLGGVSTGSVSIARALVYGGVTLSNAVTGTGNMVLATAPSVSGLTVTGSFTATGLVGNASLANPSTTVNGQTCTLGSSCTVTAAATSITVASTTVASGTTTRILYNNAGTLGEYTLSGSGTVVAMATGASLTTPAIGVATGTSLALAGCTLSTNALCATGTANISGAVTIGGALTYGGVTLTANVTGTGKMVLDTAPTFASTIDVTTGIKIASAATSGNYLRGNGTNFVSAAIAAGDLPLGSSAAFGAVKVDNTTITASGGVITAVGGTATSVQIGVTTITSGTTGRLIYNNAGVLGEAIVGTGLSLSGGTLALSNSMAANKLQVALSGSGTLTTPTGAGWAKFTLVGGGAGGVGGGTGPGTAATAGGNTCINTSGASCTSPVYQAGGGGIGSFGTGAGGAGGTIAGSGTCSVGVVGGGGGAQQSVAGVQVGFGGGNSSLGGGGNGAITTGAAGATNSGSGGQGGAGPPATGFGGPGGGAGATCIVFITSPAASYTYAIGAGGNGGGAGTSGNAGGAGGSGVVIAEYGFD